MRGIGTRPVCKIWICTRSQELALPFLLHFCLCRNHCDNLGRVAFGGQSSCISVIGSCLCSDLPNLVRLLQTTPKLTSFSTIDVEKNLVVKKGPQQVDQPQFSGTEDLGHLDSETGKQVLCLWAEEFHTAYLRIETPPCFPHLGNKEQQVEIRESRPRAVSEVRFADDRCEFLVSIPKRSLLLWEAFSQASTLEN